MKLKDHIARLQQIVDSNPAAAELDVVTARDDEGNGFNQVHYHPSLGHLDEDDMFVNEVGPDGHYTIVCLN